ncbi:MAG TPA: cell division protein FtsK, partial [Blastocatellia bacterium]|nr:cell division protein FtsK [Blastocatellia bacterium]
MLVASLLLISNFSIEWLVSTFELPIQNLKTRIREWFERRRLKGVQRHDAALERAQRRRELREHPIATEPPTVPIPDTIIAEPVPATIVEKPAKKTRAMKTEERIEAAEAVDEAEQKPAEEKKAEEKPEEKKVVGKEGYTLPSSELLNPAPPRIAHNDARLRDLAVLIGEKSREFNVAGTVSRYSPGPVVTTFQFKPDAGVKYARVTNLADDLCLALEAESIRIDRIPGTAHVGIEVPNQDRETIFLRDVIESPQFRKSTSPLTIALGKTISGENYVTDLAKMPHLLIAGATGAGKSVGVNSLVVSMLYKATPEDVLFIMVDPKRLELGLYADIPHLRNPIITEPKEAANALQWAVREMENRYKRLAGYAVRNIEGYNAEAKRRNAAKQFDEDGNPHEKLPYIVIIIDELADLMIQAA